VTDTRFKKLQRKLIIIQNLLMLSGEVCLFAKPKVNIFVVNFVVKMQMKHIRYSFQYFIMMVVCFTSALPIGAQSTENLDTFLVSSIKSGDIDAVTRLVTTNNINTLLKPDNESPLIIAIKAKQPIIVKFLLDNKADPNLQSNGHTPLMQACLIHSYKQIKILLSKGASINEIDSAGNTALMYAVISQTHKVAKLLLHHGASLIARNNEGFTAYNIAMHSNNKPVVNYLRTIFESHMPDYLDGPYTKYRTKSKIEVTYIKHDSHKNRTEKLKVCYNLKKTHGWIHGIAGDSSSYFIQSDYQPERAVYTNVEKIYIIGDIHGQCDTLIKFFINNHVTDRNLRWCFGNGHVVLLGDVFDRGESVTEALWLIYRLEQEAKSAGGGVHLILGNHEIMKLLENMHNLSEISDKYYYLFNSLKLDYFNYYDRKSVMGRWLASKPILLKINDLLFVHGGINPKLLNYQVSIDSVNHVIYQYLIEKQKKRIPTPLVNFLLGSDGPFWYRGMMPRKNIKISLTELEINQILAYYNVKTVMVGHTSLPHIITYYSGKVYGLDIPFYRYPGKPMEALYIEDSAYYRAFTNGMKAKFK
jgi:hypothetical protein